MTKQIFEGYATYKHESGLQNGQVLLRILNFHPGDSMPRIEKMIAETLQALGELNAKTGIVIEPCTNSDEGQIMKVDGIINERVVVSKRMRLNECTDHIDSLCGAIFFVRCEMRVKCLGGTVSY